MEIPQGQAWNERLRAEARIYGCIKPAPHGRSRAGRKEVLEVAGVNQQSGNAFDFSQDALDFRARLWKKLKTQMTMTSVQELEDEDLEWINAAGMAVRAEDEDAGF